MNFTTHQNISNYAMKFERFVYTVLKRISVEKQKNVIYYSEFGNREKTQDNLKGFDACFPNGFEYNNYLFGEEVYVEIRYRLYLSTYKMIVKSFNEQFKKDKRKRLLIITNSDIDNKNLMDVDNFDNITVWGSSVIDSLKKNFKLESNAILGTDYELSEETLKQSSDINKSSLNKDVNNEDNYITLVLGSGVSRDYSIPTWDELINTFLTKKEITSKISDPEYVFSKIGNSALIKGQFIVDNYSSKKDQQNKENDFCKELQKEFYKGISFKYLRGTTVDAIVQFINRHSIEGNSKRLNVLTYNYDDILEKSLDSIGFASYQPIYSDVRVSATKMPIYHVHGYLPRDREIDYELSDSVVFSEYKYHQLFNNPLMWQLSCQVSRFKEDLCLFIGFSLFDPSVRRLLEGIANKSSRTYHYAIFAKDHASSRSDKDIEVISEHFLRLGIQIIWVDEYKDIPDYLKSIL